MRGDLLVNHLALPVTDRCHVDLDTTRPRAVLGAMTHERCDFRALNLVLAGQAIDVGARATNPSPLHHRRATSRSRHVPREELPACTTAENQELELFRLHCDLLRVMRSFAVRRGGEGAKNGSPLHVDQSALAPRGRCHGRRESLLSRWRYRPRASRWRSAPYPGNGRSRSGGLFEMLRRPPG